MSASLARTVFCTFVMTLGGVVMTGAQSAQPVNPFAKAQVLACTFPTYAAARWMGGKPEPLNGSQEFSFRIEAIDYKKNQARMVGSRSVPVTVRLGPTGFNVIEQTPSGNFTLTTAFTSGANGKTFLAVHSRHLGDATELPSTSQAYGTCELVQ